MTNLPKNLGCRPDKPDTRDWEFIAGAPLKEMPDFDTGYDAETGKFDVDMILQGKSRSKLNKLEKMLDRMKELFEENEWKALEKSNVIQLLEIEGFDRTFIDKSIDTLLKEGTLYSPKQNQIKMTREK